jgi:Ulp1 family protease
MTYLVSNQNEEGFQTAADLVTGVDSMFAHRLIFLPTLQQSTAHWTLTVVDCQQKRLFHYDSFGGAGMKDMRLVRQFLTFVKKNDDNHSQVAVETFQCTLRRKNIPLQRNDYDCGVFLLSYAECVARDMPFDFLEVQMKVRLSQIVHTLLSNY